METDKAGTGSRRKNDENLLVEFLVWTSPYLPIAGVLLVVCIFLNALWPR
jgi:hypothetical protein